MPMTSLHRNLPADSITVGQMRAALAHLADDARCYVWSEARREHLALGVLVSTLGDHLVIDLAETEGTDAAR